MRHHITRTLVALSLVATALIPAAPRTAHAGDPLPAEILLIPNSSTRNIMAFDPQDGTLLDEAFIENPGTVDGFQVFNRPLHAIDSGRGTILVGDQLRHIVAEFGFDGTYLGIFAPAGGQDTNILNNIRGLAMQADGQLLVSNSGSGINPNNNSIVRFDQDGVQNGTLIFQRYGGIRGPFDVLLLDDMILVAADQSNFIARYTPEGKFDELFARGLQFPQQLATTPSDTILCAVFSGGYVAEFMMDGTPVGVYAPPGLGGYRGVHELGNGNLLVTTSTGVQEITRTGLVVGTKFASNELRYIQRITLPEERRMAGARKAPTAQRHEMTPDAVAPDAALERGEAAVTQENER